MLISRNPTVFDCKIYLFSYIYILLYTKTLARRTFVNESLTILAWLRGDITLTYSLAANP